MSRLSISSPRISITPVTSQDLTEFPVLDWSFVKHWQRPLFGEREGVGDRAVWAARAASLEWAVHAQGGHWDAAIDYDIFKLAVFGAVYYLYVQKVICLTIKQSPITRACFRYVTVQRRYLTTP